MYPHVYFLFGACTPYLFYYSTTTTVVVYIKMILLSFASYYICTTVEIVEWFCSGNSWATIIIIATKK